MDKAVNIIFPIISVVMPVYNGEKYLHEAIESILNQTFTNFEFIIINDGSIDASEKIILSYQDERIIYIKNSSNLGVINSLNVGIDIAKGKYIARMDADDIAINNRLKEQIFAFEKNENLCLVSSDYYLLKSKKLKKIKNKNASDYLKTILLFSTCFCHPTVMMKNKFKSLNLNYDTNFIHAEDYKLWTDLSFEGEFFNVSLPLLKYRSHDSQISSLHHHLQLEISRNIRQNYLKKLGFEFTKSQFEIHNFIGDNQFIDSKNKLIDIENWLQNLIYQNRNLKKLSEIEFQLAIHKYWSDSCGYSNLGLLAYFMYLKSPITKTANPSFNNKCKVLIKSIIRKYF